MTETRKAADRRHSPMIAEFSVDRFDPEGGKLVAEASDLGFAPGLWPAGIMVTWEGGQARFYLRELTDDRATYYDAENTEMTILND